MRLLLIILLFSGFSLVKAQSSVAIGVSLEPSFSIPQKNSYGGLFAGQPAFNGGISGLYFINHQTFFRTGVNYRLRGFVNKNVPNTSNVIDSMGNVILENITYFDIRYKYHYLSFPISFNYITSSQKDLGRKKLSFLFSGGVELSYLFKGRLEYKNYIVDGNKTEYNYLYTQEDIGKRFAGTLSFGVGLYKDFSPRNFILIIQPLFTYDLLGLSFNEKLKFYSFGLNMAVHFKGG
ncbi:outer membrane beta-barrel protein [Crocinitomix catalasitica]|nr:outer membrane beta-barrel protein [Crocinitomix catalasitica]